MARVLVVGKAAIGGLDGLDVELREALDGDEKADVLVVDAQTGPRASHAHIVVTDGPADADVTRRALEAGAEDAIDRNEPLAPVLLARAVRRALARSAEHRDAAEKW